MDHTLLLGATGIVAGGMNALAGGGSFVTLPALITAGVPSVAANASSTIALWPGGAVSAFVYRDGLRPVAGVPLTVMSGVTLAGGVVGGVLLLITPTGLFDRLLPWLLLIATLALACGRQLGEALRRHHELPRGAVLGAQALLGIYGGYYGGAVGIMMMAVWRLLDGADVKALNAPRTLMVTIANGAAVLCFVIAGAARWADVIPLGIGAILGGAGGAWLGRRLPTGVVRLTTLLLCAAITLAFFWHAYE